MNLNTHWLDASFLYGSTQERTDLVRKGAVGKGELAFSVKSGYGYPANQTTPITEMLMPVTSDPAMSLGARPGRPGYIGGDVRVSISVAAAAMATVWLREHNRVARRVARAAPELTDDGVFEMARLIVATAWKRVVCNEYVTAVTGEAVPAWAYSTNATSKWESPLIDEFFAAAAFRFAHSALATVFPRLDASWQESPEGPLLLRENILSGTAAFDAVGVDSLLRGQIASSAYAVDAKLVDDLRLPVLDMAAINIQRGRDLGLPSYTEARRAFGLSVPATFEEIAGVTAENVATLKALYPGGVGTLDAWVGGLLESQAAGLNGMVGPLFQASIVNQFKRLRNADRMYDPLNFTTAFPDVASFPERSTYREIYHLLSVDSTIIALASAAKATSLSEIIKANTGITDCPSSVFVVLPRSPTSTSTADKSSGSGTLVLLADEKYSVSWTIGTADPSVINLSLTGPSKGFMGFGFGDSPMTNVDLWVARLTDKGAPEVIDAFSPSFNPAPDERSDVIPGSVSLAPAGDGLHTITFSRKLVTGDPQDYAIVRGDPTPVFFALGGSHTLAYHGPRRGLAAVDFFSGAVAVAPASGVSSRRVQVLHGCAMIFAWTLCVPLAVITSRYLKASNHWIRAHQILAGLGSASAVPLAFAAIANMVKQGTSTHAIIGLCIVGALVAQVLVGDILSSSLEKPRYARMGVFRLFHRFIGRALMVISPYQVYLGIERLVGMQGGYRIGYFTWLSVLIATFVVLEIRSHVPPASKKGGMGEDELPSVTGSEEDTSVATGRSGGLAGAMARARKKSLASFYTMARFEAECARGEKLIISGDLVCDIGEWMFKHPGGKFIISQFVGKDATAVISGSEKSSGVRHKHSNAAVQKVAELAVGRLLSAAPPPKAPPAAMPALASAPGDDKWKAVSRVPALMMARSMSALKVVPTNWGQCRITSRVLVSESEGPSRACVELTLTPAGATTSATLFDSVVPGQHFMLGVSPSEARPYTHYGKGQFLIRSVPGGKVSPALASLAEGSLVSVYTDALGVPLDDLFADHRDEWLVFLVAGTGVASVIAYLERPAGRQFPAKINIVLQNRLDHPMLDRLRQARAAHGGGRMITIQTLLSSEGRRIDTTFIRTELPKRALFVVIGPPNFEKALKDELLSEGHSPDSVVIIA